ncbi:ABC transporter ATP-binding protein [Clostridium estertheticum]|uniref:ABC transporter ATP-binding protein n=1 Tax=Clostridium estertheticum TaxID=238834 RepID=UPI001C6DD58F|nr:ABC transporter ATP-binding protein [Clostridium estertheticum]MBW9153063.1 ABC transporter ATP-binding protein/permease [Clostridium estertheticum]WLC82578.1 ABC transporter ATP-binding protein/permease [Clostridium estertheticum]
MARNKYDVDEKLESEFNMGHVKRLMRYVIPYKKKMVITIVIMLIASVANLIGPYLIKVALDSKIPNKDVAGLIILSLIYLVTVIINGVCLNIKIKSMTDIGQSVILNIRKDLFTHLQKLPFSYYDSRPHGKILVRVVNYVNSLSDLLSNGIINLITDSFSLIVIIVFMFLIDIRLTLIGLVGLPILVGAAFTIKSLQRKAFQILSSKSSNVNAYIHESICGMKVTQSFSREKENLKIFNELSDNYRKAWMHAIKIQFLMGPFVDNIGNLVVVAVYIMGVAWIANGAITIGVLIAFIAYIGRFWGPINSIANTYNAIINNMAYLERIFETMDEEPNVKDLQDAYEMPEIKGLVEFKNVNFCYDDGQRILNDVNFKANKGESIALVGPTGAGKTTIINLISRFYDLESGAVLIDGVNVRDVLLNSLRKQMGIMLQDSFIFSGTIMDNIRYGKLDATDKEVVAAARVVRAHEFITTLSEGYNTQVNERGSRLSAGQRQLISFARALLADPRILILDEATSSIDTETEMLLQKGLEELLKGRTSFIIAHRLSTIKNSDRIMYIDHGSIVESGSHDELMKYKGEYYDLYMSQYKMLEAI